MRELKYSEEYPFKPFVFIGERLKQNYDPSRTFLKNYNLKFADQEQIKAIKLIAKTDELIGLKTKYGAINMYENDLVITSTPGSRSVIPTPLNPENFKYWIIEFPEYLFDNNILPSISLMSNNLTVIAQIGKIGAYNFDHLKAAVYYSDNDILFKEPVVINEEDIIELEFIYESLNNFKATSFFTSSIGKTLNDFISTSRIEYDSPFKVIALFSVIETLLTTTSKNSDQSINRQLQKKIKLLNNQFEKKLDFTKYFKGPDTLTEELIIEKLYTYRSKIAHGDYYDFNKELQVLGDHKTIFEFLNLLTKRLILFSINNCQFMLDLKEC